MSGLVLTHSRKREEASSLHWEWRSPPMCQCMLESLSAPSPLLHCREAALPTFGDQRSKATCSRSHSYCQDSLMLRLCSFSSVPPSLLLLLREGCGPHCGSEQREGRAEPDLPGEEGVGSSLRRGREYRRPGSPTDVGTFAEAAGR